MTSGPVRSIDKKASVKICMGANFMPAILNDIEIKKLLGTVIVRGDKSSISPNSYILRIGGKGEYLNTNKKFEIGEEKNKKGISIPPGHSVGLIAFEDIDFRRETVHKIFPGYDLHAIITPTTTLSREGLVAPATQVDAGWNGTLNWTLVNTSNKERRYLHKEKVFRMTIFKLMENEIPVGQYDGKYQEKFGYVRSMRTEAPVGMEMSEWETAYQKGGPEDLLEILSQAGPPWNALSKRLVIIDDKFESVTSEYKAIKESIDELSKDVKDVCSDQVSTQNNMKSAVEDVLDRKFESYEAGFLNKIGKYFLGAIGLVVMIVFNDKAWPIVQANGTYLGLGLIILALLYHFLAKKR